MSTHTMILILHYSKAMPWVNCFVFRFTINQNKMLTLGDHIPIMGCVPQVICQPMGTALNNLNLSKEFNISFTLSDYFIIF